MKKLNKKAFTIVELIVVIVIIGILAAILIPNVVKYIDQTKVIKDKELVSNLNKALAYDRLEKGIEIHETPTAALEAAQAHGYNVAVINKTSKDGNEILWDSVNDVYLYLEDGTKSYVPDFEPKKSVKDSQIWKISNTIDAQYATYYTGTETTVTVDKGFDAGESAVTSISLVRTASIEHDVVIRTNSASTTLTIDDESTGTIYHYGEAGALNIIQCHTASYHENGKVAFAEIAKGRIVLESGSEIKHIHVNAKEDNSGNNLNEFDTIIIADNGAKALPEAITRDQVDVSEAKPVVTVETGNTSETVYVYPYTDAQEAKTGTTEQTETQNTSIASALGKLVLDNGSDAGEKAMSNNDKEAAKTEVVNEAKVIELEEKQAACVHEFDENGVCTKCGLKQALTDAKLVEQGYVVRVVGGDGYMSLAEGMLALHENDTLKVLQDITLTSQTTAGLSAQKCIIDLNGKTITASGTWKLSKTVYEYMTYEEFLDLGCGTPTKEEYDADPYPLGITENPVDVTIMNGTYVVNGTGSGRIRFEKGSTGHFENVIIKSSSDTNTYQGLQTYACNDDGKIEKNVYSFTECSFENVYLGFEGSAGSCNRYDISFKDCSFDSTTSGNGYNQIYIDDYNYGDLSIDSCHFNLVGNATGGAANCFYIDTYLSYVSGRIVNVTVVDSTFEVYKNANPYNQRFMSYNSVYMDNSFIDISNSTFTKDGKAVEPAIKEQTATSKSLVWVSNAEDFIACYAEWLSYVKSSPACTSYNSLNYYLVECNGHYFVMGQGQQYASTAVITMEDDTVVQVLTRPSYGQTFNTIGTTDISLELGENDNANIHIYTLAN